MRYLKKLEFIIEDNNYMKEGVIYYYVRLRDKLRHFKEKLTKAERFVINKTYKEYKEYLNPKVEVEEPRYSEEVVSKRFGILFETSEIRSIINLWFDNYSDFEKNMVNIEWIELIFLAFCEYYSGSELPVNRQFTLGWQQAKVLLAYIKNTDLTGLKDKLEYYLSLFDDHDRCGSAIELLGPSYKERDESYYEVAGSVSNSIAHCLLNKPIELGGLNI